jgi:phosphoribosylformylglycinamidine cyclo-ligase
VHGFAHITGGGLTDNIPRVLPDGLGVQLDARAWQRDPVWDWIQESGRIGDAEMHRTFNCGVGMVALVARADAAAALELLRAAGERATVIGEVMAGSGVQIG